MSGSCRRRSHIYAGAIEHRADHLAGAPDGHGPRCCCTTSRPRSSPRSRAAGLVGGRVRRRALRSILVVVTGALVLALRTRPGSRGLRRRAVGRLRRPSPPPHALRPIPTSTPSPPPPAGGRRPSRARPGARTNRPDPPGEIAGWPKLVVTYTTDPAEVAALLPPGLEPLDPVVTVGFYCVPVLDEPELGVSVKVEAAWQGVAGQYNLGLGIDQEAAVHVSGETNGQPKFLCDIAYFRFGDRVTARASHQGYTFVEFTRHGHRRGRDRATVSSSSTSGGPSTRAPSAAPRARTTSRRTSSTWRRPSSSATSRTSTASSCCATARGTRSPGTSRLRARSCPAGHPATHGAPAVERRAARPRRLLALRRRHRRQPMARPSWGPRPLTTTERSREAGMGATTDRYVVISADCHGGASIAGYRPYLDVAVPRRLRRVGGRRSRTPTTTSPATTPAATGTRTAGCASSRPTASSPRSIFPNTIPPFFPKVVARAPAARRRRRRPRAALGRAAGPQPVAGRLLRRRARAPGRHRPDHAARRRRVGARDRVGRPNGLTGGVLLPGAPPGSGVPPLYAPDYEPIWSACEELGLPVNHHSGSAAPDFGDYPAAQLMFLLEVTWWAHRTLWHLIFSGVMERHPTLQFVFTEQGTAWLPEELTRLDYYHGRLSGHRRRGRLAGGEVRRAAPSSAVAHAVGVLGPPVPRRVELHPPPRGRAARRGRRRPDHVGQRLPPPRGLLAVLPPAPAPGLRRRARGRGAGHGRAATPPDVYGFDLDALAPLADRVGPSPAEVAEPLAARGHPRRGAALPGLRRGPVRAG